MKKSKKPKKRNPLKTLENKLDVVFSKVVRKQGFCLRCYKTENIQCSHIHSRRKMSVRWDLLNAFCLCAGCHKFWWHKHPIDAAEFAKQKLGEFKYNELLNRANSIKKWTLEEMQELYKVLEKELYASEGHED